MRRFTGIVLIALVMCFIGFWFVPKGSEFDESFRIQDAQAQNILIERLEQLGINHKVDEHNAVWFKSSDSDVVHKIAMEVMSESEPDSIVVRYTREKFTRLFKEKLKKKGVPYTTVYRDGKAGVEVQLEHKARWRPIKHKVDRLFMEWWASPSERGQ